MKRHLPSLPSTRTLLLCFVCNLCWSAPILQAKTNDVREVTLVLPLRHAVGEEGERNWRLKRALRKEDVIISPRTNNAVSTMVLKSLNGDDYDPEEDEFPPPGDAVDNLLNLRTRLAEYLGYLNADGNGDRSKILQTSDPASLPENVPAGTEIDWRVTLTTPAPVSVDEISILLISLSCPSYGQNPLPPNYHRIKLGNLKELNRNYKLRLVSSSSLPFNSIKCEAIYSKEDLELFSRRNRVDLEAGAELLHKQYQQMATRYLVKLHKAGAIADPTLLKDTAADIHSKLHGFPGSAVKSERSDTTVALLLEGIGLRAPAQIEVLGNEELQNQLQARFLSLESSDKKERLLLDGTRLYVNDMIQADLGRLARDSSIGSATALQTKKGIVYRCVAAPSSNRPFTVEAGSEFLPDKGFLPALAFRVPSNEEDEADFAFEVKGGTAAIAGELNYVSKVHSLQNSQTWDTYQIVASGMAEEFDEARFGNVNRGELDSETLDFSTGVLLQSDSFSHADTYWAALPSDEDVTKRLFHSTEIGFRFREVNLDGSPSDLAGLEEGARSGPYVDAKFLLGDALVSGLGNTSEQGWWLDGLVSLNTSLQALGGDADYLRLVADLEIRNRWRIYETIEVYPTLGTTGAWTSGGTPTYDYVGAGNPEFIRGLHETEFIGRKYVGLRAGLGFDVSSLFVDSSGKKKKSTSESEPANTDEKILDTSAIILLGPFADAGWLFDRVEDGVMQSGDRAIQSFGLQMDVIQTSVLRAPTAISLGYGWSPQSSLHESGSFFSRVSVSF